MEWIEGDPLGIWLDKHYANPNVLQGVRRQFQEVAAYLEKNDLGHGDMQNGNIIVSNHKLN
jgi:tRNA A-37 threonylcarbamoyl transferase component Bud32